MNQSQTSDGDHRRAHLPIIPLRTAENRVFLQAQSTSWSLMNVNGCTLNEVKTCIYWRSRIFFTCWEEEGGLLSSSQDEEEIARAHCGQETIHISHHKLL